MEKTIHAVISIVFPIVIVANLVYACVGYYFYYLLRNMEPTEAVRIAFLFKWTTPYLIEIALLGLL